MAHKLIFIPNDDTLSVDYNQWLKRLDTQLNKPTNQNSIKSPKLLNQRIKKRYDKTLGTSIIKKRLALFLPGESYLVLNYVNFIQFCQTFFLIYSTAYGNSKEK